LAEALTDDRVDASEYADAEALLRRPAVTYPDIDAVVGGLDARVSLTERTDYSRPFASLLTSLAEGLTSQRPATCTVGTVSLPSATARTAAADSASSQMLTSVNRMRRSRRPRRSLKQ
jgi:hypothetical protein